MRIFMRPASACPPAVVERARTRLEFALGRFTGRVRSLSVRLTDLNGPRGGHDKRCQLDLRLVRPRRVIVIEDVDADFDVAVSRAADRAARAVARAVDLSTAAHRLRGTGHGRVRHDFA
jgi:putative sigma-54 modulation protein